MTKPDLTNIVVLAYTAPSASSLFKVISAKSYFGKNESSNLQVFEEDGRLYWSTQNWEKTEVGTARPKQIGTYNNQREIRTGIIGVYDRKNNRHLESLAMSTWYFSQPRESNFCEEID